MIGRYAVLRSRAMRGDRNDGASDGQTYLVRTMSVKTSSFTGLAG